MTRRNALSGVKDALPFSCRLTTEERDGGGRRIAGEFALVLIVSTFQRRAVVIILGVLTAFVYRAPA